MDAIEALAEIRNKTILWRRGTETDLLREIHRIAQEGIDASFLPEGEAPDVRRS